MLIIGYGKIIFLTDNNFPLVLHQKPLVDGGTSGISMP